MTELKVCMIKVKLGDSTVTVVQRQGLCSDALFACQSCFCRWGSSSASQSLRGRSDELSEWGKWSSDFKSGQVGTRDNEKRGRFMSTSTPENKAWVEATITDNRWMTDWAWAWFGSIAWDNCQDYSGVKLPWGWCVMGSTRCKEWLVLSHSSNSMPFMVTVFSNA